MRALQISPFPISDAPTSGGQVRVVEMAHSYLRAGWQVDRCVVHDRGKPLPNALNVCLGWWDRQRRRHIGRPKGIANLRHVWAWKSERSSRSLTQQLVAAGLPRYDVIQCEHPWDFDLAWRLRESGACPHAQLFYSAHNIEAELHANSWQSNGQWSHAAARLVQEIRRHESDVARRADVCWAVSEKDAEFLRDAGASKVHVAPNGVHELAAQTAQREMIGTPYALFIASDHVPNVTGFQQWLPASLGRWMPPGTALLLAGTVGRALRRDARYADDFAAKRLIDLGLVERGRLDQLIHHAHALILPITTGGGTSLKAAEALVSGRPVITTAAGVRGFEPYAAEPRVTLVTQEEAFRNCVESALRAPFQVPHRDPACEQLTWTHALAAVTAEARAACR
jgi:glycosyltransferase involved in cell wall biosynthesis